MSVVERLKLGYDGVTGSGAKSDEPPDTRFCARWTGRKMPEPGTEVSKYWVLRGHGQYRQAGRQ